MFGLFNRTKAYPEMNAGEFQQALKSDAQGVLLDVRTASEYRMGHIPKSTNMDIMSSGFQEKISKLDPDKTYYVYCQSGNRSGQACNIMTKAGLKAVNLSGGIMRWTGPVVR